MAYSCVNGHGECDGCMECSEPKKIKKKLDDGRNAHLIIESPNWWINKIKSTMVHSKIISSEVVEFAAGKPELRLILEK